MAMLRFATFSLALCLLAGLAAAENKDSKESDNKQPVPTVTAALPGGADPSDYSSDKSEPTEPNQAYPYAMGPGFWPWSEYYGRFPHPVLGPVPYWGPLGWAHPLRQPYPVGSGNDYPSDKIDNFDENQETEKRTQTFQEMSEASRLDR
uniref:Putative secreted protein n=1 Tax=Amblyomma cajennense TaxID=34607 RepID=A0A023FC11_AMBCJ